MQAIEVLLSHGVKEEKILFLNLVSLKFAYLEYSITDERGPVLDLVPGGTEDGLRKVPQDEDRMYHGIPVVVRF